MVHSPQGPGALLLPSCLTCPSGGLPRPHSPWALGSPRSLMSVAAALGARGPQAPPRGLRWFRPRPPSCAVQRVPRYLVSSLLDETIEAVAAGLSTAVYQRPGPRAPARRRRKGGRRSQLRLPEVPAVAPEALQAWGLGLVSPSEHPVGGLLVWQHPECASDDTASPSGSGRARRVHVKVRAVSFGPGSPVPGFPGWGPLK